MHATTSRSYTSDEALARLVAGNERFVRGEARFPTVQKEILAQLASGQQSVRDDSRVQRFARPTRVGLRRRLRRSVHRAGGGQRDLAGDHGDAPYAGSHLRTPLFVVLGHEGCGAVDAALAVKLDGTPMLRGIALLVDNILPGLRELPSGLTPGEQRRAAVEANVRWSMQQILETPEGKARQAEGVMKLVGAVYELESGLVRFLA